MRMSESQLEWQQRNQSGETVGWAELQEQGWHSVLPAHSSSCAPASVPADKSRCSSWRSSNNCTGLPSCSRYTVWVGERPPDRCKHYTHELTHFFFLVSAIAISFSTSACLLTSLTTCSLSMSAAARTCIHTLLLLYKHQRLVYRPLPAPV